MKIIHILFLSSFLAACNVDTSPVEAIDEIVSELGYIPYQNPLKGISTGTMIGGRPSALAYIAPANECFPEEEMERNFDEQYLNRKYSNTFQGNLGFLTFGSSVVSGALNLSKDHFVNIEIDGINIEYLNSLDVTRYYRNGMSEECQDYLDSVGFVIQSIKTEKLTISIYDRSGVSVVLDETNINDYLTISGDADWTIINDIKVEITTPHYIGYQLGQIRKRDNSMVLKRAFTTSEDSFIFEDISVFEPETTRQENFVMRKSARKLGFFIP